MWKKPELIPINIGDVVVRDEVVRTSADSDARIGLLDDTKLTLGPGSTLKIDRAVYSGETSYKQITIRLTTGAFRFITGHSDKKSYKIETPFASIGVRGTILDIQVLQNQTLVALQDRPGQRLRRHAVHAALETRANRQRAARKWRHPDQARIDPVLDLRLGLRR